MKKVTAYLLEHECGAFPDEAAARMLGQPRLMRPDGHLDCDAAQPGAGVALPDGHLVVVPRLFLGRDADARLGFLCDLAAGVDGAGEQRAAA
jgi:hypothetical protein